MLYLILYEHTGAPTGQEETFPHEDYDMPHPSRKHTISDISDLVSYPKRGNYNTNEVARTTATNTQTNVENTKDENQSHFETDDQVIAYFTSMKNCPDGINNAEYLNIAHEQIQTNKIIEKNQDTQINLSDFIPEPKSLSQVLKLSPLDRKSTRLNSSHP